jgi:hypothetical protein
MKVLKIVDWAASPLGLCIAAVTLVGCASNPAPGSPEERLAEVREQKEQIVERAQTAASNIPDWFLEDGDTGAAVFGLGETAARSSTLARLGAEAQARANLALKFNSWAAAKITEYLDSEQEGDWSDLQAAIENKGGATLKGARRVALQEVMVPGGVHFYAKFELPIGEANRLLVGEILADKNASLQARKSEAFRDLEKIHGERNNAQ